MAEQLVELWEEGWKFILVHGGGSYGHWTATRYSVNEGYKGLQSIKGYLATRKAMLLLDEVVSKILVETGLPVTPLHPSCLIIARNGVIEKFFLEPVKTALVKGFVPLLQGDVVLDLDKGFSIVSGDQIIYFLAEKFKPSKVVFGTDVKGIYDKNPKLYPDAKLFRKIPLKLLKALDTSKIMVPDVTGGLKEKINYVSKIVCKGIPVCVGSLIEPRNLIRMVKGEEGDYTLILGW